MSTTVVIGLGIGVLALLLVGLGWRIGRLGERIRSQRHKGGAGGDKSRHPKHVVIQIGNNVRMTYRK